MITSNGKQIDTYPYHLKTKTKCEQSCKQCSFHFHPLTLAVSKKMKCLLLLFAGVLGIAQAQQTFTNPILDEIAPDPCIVKHDGYYYMVYTQHNIIEVLKSRTLSNFRNAERILAYTAPPNRANLWAPEIHLIRGRFYIYFTMDDGVADANHRMYVIQANDALNPMGTWSAEIRLLPEEEIYAIDGTVLQYGNGELYFIWTGFPEPPGSMNLYISRMPDPTRVLPPRTLLRTPSMEWEMHGYPVNEGPFIIQKDGRTFLVFSGSSTFTPDYCGYFISWISKLIFLDTFH